MNKYCKLLACMLALGAPLRAADFGLILDQNAAYGGTEKDSAPEYDAELIPRFSVPVGDMGSVYVSANARLNWKNDALAYMPELLRTEFSLDFGKGELKLGRIPYADPLGFIANGLFDGVSASLDAGGGSFSLGAWYTGLLYRERAHITMTSEELESYNTVLNYEDFTNTYFAPRRVVAALGWEHQGLAERARLQLTLLGQYDLTEENSLHSQYAATKFSVPVNTFVFDLGGCLELIESADEYKVALAGELGLSWLFWESRLSLLVRHATGVAEDGSLTAFLPINTVYQGQILNAPFSGLSVISLDYLSRVHRTLSAGVTASLFIRGDLGTYTGYPVTVYSNDGYVLGTELFGRLWWSPISDIQISLGSGGFMPAMGNTYRNAPMLWRVEMNLILALY